MESINSTISYRTRDVCEVCTNSKTTILIDRPYTEESIWGFIHTYYEGRVPKEAVEAMSFKVLECSNCGFIWHSHVLEDELSEQLYENWISSQHSLDKKKYADITLFRQYSAQASAIALFANKKPNEIKVLDFGMGWGFWCLMAKAFGYDTYGFEISRNRISFAEDNGIHIIKEFELLKEHKFDYINSDQVFEHITEPRSTVRFLRSILNENGVIRISVPNGELVKARLNSSSWKASKDEIQPLEHINCFSNRSLRFMCEAEGLHCLNPDHKTNLCFAPSAKLAQEFSQRLSDNELRPEVLRNKVKALENSSAYKLGRILLLPFRILKKLFLKRT